MFNALPNEIAPRNRVNGLGATSQSQLSRRNIDMTTITTNGRLLAIAAGTAFTYGGLRIILGDQLTDPAQWTTGVQLTVLMVGGTIAAGHLMRDAGAAKRYGAAFGFLVLFLAGTGLVVLNSVGRQAENSMLTVSQADDAAERRIAIKAALARSEAMLSEAQAGLARECKTGKGKRCEGIQATIAVYEAAVKGHTADLEKIGPQKPVNAKAAHMAKILALSGADEAKAKAALLLLEPFLWTLFFEIGSIVSLGFAFRGITESAPGKITDEEIEEFKRATSNDTEPLPPTKAIVPDMTGSNIVPWAQAFRAQHGRPARLDEVQAAFPEVARTTAWRRLKAA
jgi:hypothetical protein